MMATLRVTQVQVRRSAPSRSSAARSARSVSGGSTTPNELPDRPEIRGMIARVPHLVDVEGGQLMKIHDLKPPPGSKTRASDASAAASAARAARPPAAAPRARARAATVAPGFEGGQTPLHRRTPKAKGFNNPFRVEYHVVNLDTLEAFDAGAEVDPGRRCGRTASWPSAAWSRCSAGASSPRR